MKHLYLTTLTNFSWHTGQANNVATNSFLKQKTFSLRKLEYPYGSRTKSKNSLKRKIWMFWFLVPRLCLLPHHSSCFFLSVWMAAARGRQYLEETKLRVQEGQRARTEARIVQLRLTELETRIADLERFRREGESKSTSTARCLSFDSAFVSSSFLLCLFVVLSYYVFTSSLRAPTLD